MWTVSKEFHFDAAHCLDFLPPTHKCSRMHGHSYKCVIHCSGDLIPDRHWVVDYADISAAVEPIIRELDHKNLNDVMMIPTTAENIAFWIYRRLFKALPVSRVDVYETHSTCCSYVPPSK